MRSHSSLLGAAAVAALFPLGAASAQGLAAVGPNNPDNGYPEWYEDATGLRLGQCLNSSGFCVLDAPVTLTNPALAFPDNYGGTFPEEFFWAFCEADLAGPGGETVLMVLALEGAFGLDTPGDRVSFARLRIRATGLIPGETYTVTTPAGVFVFVAENAARNINFTNDVGILDGVFTGALAGDVGPFLRWDSDLPLTDLDGNEYLGNPNVPHTITGSPFGTNFLSIEGGGLNLSTDLFALQGLVVPVVVDPPVANFSATPVSGTEPLDVGFTDLSTGDITSWSWDFGDLGSSALQSPSHVYAAGTYSPSLTVTGPGGSDTITMVDLITVDTVPPPPGAPVANFSATPVSGTEPLNVGFSDLSTGDVTAWAWDFGDGFGSILQNPSHVYAAGTYSPSLTVTGPGGSDSFSMPGLITVDAVPPPAAPVASFSAAPTSGTEPLSVAFTDLSTGDITSRSWDFGDLGGSALQNPSHSYAAGTYSPSLTVTGPGGSDTITMTNLVAVAPAPPPPGNTLVLSQPVPGLAGVPNALTISGGTPGRVAGIYTGLVQGATILNLGACGGLPIALNNPFRLIAKVRIQGDGTAIVMVRPPATAAGTTFHFQAVEPFSCRSSNLVSDQL